MDACLRFQFHACTHSAAPGTVWAVGGGRAEGGEVTDNKRRRSRHKSRPRIPARIFASERKKKGEEGGIGGRMEKGERSRSIDNGQINPASLNKRKPSPQTIPSCGKEFPQRTARDSCCICMCYYYYRLIYTACRNCLIRREFCLPTKTSGREL